MVLQTEFFEGWGQLSSDGRWMAYHSYESGRDEVYVQPFPGSGPKSRISRDGGSFPKWRGDGKEIFFVLERAGAHGGRRQGGEAFTAGEPKSLFVARHKQNVYRD